MSTLETILFEEATRNQRPAPWVLQLDDETLEEAAYTLWRRYSSDAVEDA